MTVGSTETPELTATNQAAAGVDLPKTKPQTIRQLETALRDVGYSRREAAAIATHGFKGLGAADDSTSLLDSVAALLAERTTLLKETSCLT